LDSNSLCNRHSHGLQAARVTSTTSAEVISKIAKKPSTKKKKVTKKKKTVASKTVVKAKVKAPVSVAKQESKAKVTKKRKKQSKKKKSKEDEPIHFYRNETDCITVLHHHHDAQVAELGPQDGKATQASVAGVGFKVRGNPAPLARHRTYRGFIFNPSAKKQKQFCDVVMDMLPNSHFCQNVTEGHSNYNAEPLIKNVDTVVPVFEKQVISIQIISRMKRPMKHFIANRPGPGRLRQSTNNQSTGAVSTSHLQVTRTDVDNLAKFVLDSLNGVLYEDDRQVASLQVTKVYDDEYPYTGSTDVIIRAMTETHLHSIANLTAADDFYP
jgi:Holliday junction resolvase RusA-like endonuclease